MFCPQCGARNPEGSRFCSSCANQLPTGVAPSQGQGPQGTMIMPPPAPQQPSAPPSPYSAPQEQNYGGNLYPQTPPPGYQQQYSQPQPQQYQQYPSYQQQPLSYTGSSKPSSKATTSLILSIASIFPGLCISFIPFVGLAAPALGIVGAVIGKNELDAINQGRSPRAGEGMAKAGFIVGIVGGILNLACALASCAGVIRG